jgi:hypothetical protein
MIAATPTVTDDDCDGVACNRSGEIHVFHVAAGAGIARVSAVTT